MVEYIEKYKWIIVFFLSICLIFVLINNYEKMENTLCGGKTCRTKSDFYTDKNTKKVENKIIHLKCTTKNEIKESKDNFFYLANINTDYNKCNACDISDIKKHMPALVDSKNIVNTNCTKNELIKCLNSQDKPNCKNYVNDLCKINGRINSKDCEFILEYYENENDSKKEENEEKKEYYLLRSNNKDKHTLSLVQQPHVNTTPTKNSTTTENGTNIEIKNPKTGDIIITPPNYLVCFDNKQNNNKIYIEEDYEKLGKDKVIFYLYFKVGEGERGKRYLGTCVKSVPKDNICDDNICKNPKACEKFIKYLCLYQDKNNDNVLWFEPEFIGFNKD